MKKAIIAALAVSYFWAAQSAELPLRRVVLSTSGLAQFTHSGEVAPGSVIELTVRLDQVDDLLKSLTIFDTAGSIRSVSLPGKTPLAEVFRDLPFGQEALQSRAALLQALMGAEVEIEGEVKAAGRIFGLEDEAVQLPNNAGTVIRHRLTLLSEKGLVQATLENLSALRFTNAQTRAQIDKALAALSENRAKEQRTLSIALAGQGKREAGFSYVVAAPVWKTSYRLVLPKEGGKARLQGWGILENLTGGNWQDVELTLVSGNPVALKQPLYSAVFADRPEVPIASSLRVVPRKDEAEARYRALLKASPQPAAPSQGAHPRGLATGAPRILAYDGLAAEEPGSAATAAEAEEAATQVLYRFPAPVTLASGSTLMIPFTDREIAASRTYLYQPETNPVHPLAAVRLHNDGETALPAGLVTAFDRSGDGIANFAGDAQLPLLGKGATKFVTFALDTKTEVHRFDRGSKQTRLGKAVRGELTLTVKSNWTIDYEITPPADEDREVIIEEARHDGWKPAGGLKELEETASRIRYRVPAPMGKTTKVSIEREHIDYQMISLTSLGPDKLLATIGGLQNESASLQETLGKLRALVAGIDKINAQRRELETERKRIAEDQERIRKNLGSVGQGSDLGRRYLETLKSHEDRLAAMSAEDKTYEQELAAKMKSAEAIAASLAL